LAEPETEAERIEREIRKARWVIANNSDKPHVVAKWQRTLRDLLGGPNDAAYWIAEAEVCMAKAKACL
jgi:hypothetical protein